MSPAFGNRCAKPVERRLVGEIERHERALRSAGSANSIVEFFHPQQPKISATELLPAGEVELDSVPVDGTHCRFRTCYDVAFQPLGIETVELESAGHGALRVRFALLGNAKPEDLRLDPLRLHLHGDFQAMTTLHLWLTRRTGRVSLEAGPRKRPRRAQLPSQPPPVRAVGFAPEEGLFPYPKHSFLGYRLLQEYFTLPQKFLFLDVHGMKALASLEPEQSFDLIFHFSERPPENLRVATENVRLHCTPVVNLFSRDADPIRLDHTRTNYLVRPADPEPNHFEVYSIDSVVGISTGTARRQVYLPFYAFRHGMEAGDAQAVYYKIRRAPAVGKPNSDAFVSFVSAEDAGALPNAETASLELTCTNRRMAEALKPGDIMRHNEMSPQFAEFHNITQLTTSAIPPLEGGFHWRLISHLTLNSASLADAEALRGLLAIYDFTALHDKQASLATGRLLQSIVRLESAPRERIFRGAVMRGVRSELTLEEDRFDSEGELYLFSALLDEFLSLYVTVNSFSQLTVVGAQKGARYEWPARVGRQFSL